MATAIKLTPHTRNHQLASRSLVPLLTSPNGKLSMRRYSWARKSRQRLSLLLTRVCRRASCRGWSSMRKVLRLYIKCKFPLLLLWWSQSLTWKQWSCILSNTLDVWTWWIWRDKSCDVRWWLDGKGSIPISSCRSMFQYSEFKVHSLVLFLNCTTLWTNVMQMSQEVKLGMRQLLVQTIF